MIGEIILGTYAKNENTKTENTIKLTKRELEEVMTRTIQTALRMAWGGVGPVRWPGHDAGAGGDDGLGDGVAGAFVEEERGAGRGAVRGGVHSMRMWEGKEGIPTGSGMSVPVGVSAYMEGGGVEMQGMQVWVEYPWVSGR